MQCLSRLLFTFLAVLTMLAALPGRVVAQGPPPRIGPIAMDLEATVPRFPNDIQLAQSRALQQSELPGAGWGVHGAATLYVLTWKAVTFGLGGDVTLARSHRNARPVSTAITGRAVTSRFTHATPELSFNFGNGNGWSYLSGGIGPGVWSIVPDGAAPTAADSEHVQTINYGGGAHWFIKHHVGFSIDVRFYAVAPTTPELGRPSSPRKTLLIIGAGVCLK